MKESAPKRQKKKGASEGAELEYTPIRRRRSANANAVVLAEDEISVAYSPSTQDAEAVSINENAEEETFANSADAPTVSESDASLENTQSEENTSSAADGISASADHLTISVEAEDNAPDASQEAAPMREDSNENEASEDIGVHGTQDEMYDTLSSVSDIADESTFAHAPSYERVVLPDEISLVGVLPLEEEAQEADEDPDESETTVEPPIEQTPEEDDEEFVFTPMPTPVVYERIVLPDEISLVDVFPEFNIPVVQEIDNHEPTEAQQITDSQEVDAAEPPLLEEAAAEFAFDEIPPYENGEEHTQVGPTSDEQDTAVERASENDSLNAPTTHADEPEAATVVESESDDSLIEETESDPLAAEFDFSGIDFDTLTPHDQASTENEAADEEANESTSLPESANESPTTDSAEENAEENELSANDENELTLSEDDSATQNEDSLAIAEEVDGEPSAESEQAPAADEDEQPFVDPSQPQGSSNDDFDGQAAPYFPDAPKKKKTRESEPEQRPIENRFDIVELFAFTLALVFIITAFFFRSSTVNGSSMANTLHHGDQLILYSFLYEPEVGDIIVFEDYTTPYKEPLVKRVIATEGQTVLILDAYTVLVDGVVLPQDYVYLDRYDDTQYPIRYTVSEGHLFVMGDHRNASSDSRVFGEVAKSSVLGKVILRYYPFADFKLFND